MTRLILTLALLLSLTAGTAHAEPDGPWQLDPASHFLIATAAQYTLADLCTKAFNRPWTCRISTAALIMAYATWEQRRHEAFGAEDWRADLVGVSTGILLLEW